VSDYLTIDNIPATDEGRAWVKQLRKYLAPHYKIRTRGRHKDRKGLAAKLEISYQSLRQDVPCKYADRLVVQVSKRSERGVVYREGSYHRARGWYLSEPGASEEQGPFKSWDAARAAKRIATGTAS
jgi:hypothetical protein